MAASGAEIAVICIECLLIVIAGALIGVLEYFISAEKKKNALPSAHDDVESKFQAMSADIDEKIALSAESEEVKIPADGQAKENTPSVVTPMDASDTEQSEEKGENESAGEILQPAETDSQQPVAAEKPKSRLEELFGTREEAYAEYAATGSNTNDEEFDMHVSELKQFIRENSVRATYRQSEFKPYDGDVIAGEQDDYSPAPAARTKLGEDGFAAYNSVENRSGYDANSFDRYDSESGNELKRYIEETKRKYAANAPGSEHEKVDWNKLKEYSGAVMSVYGFMNKDDEEKKDEK